jgi:hypothetical protein
MQFRLEELTPPHTKGLTALCTNAEQFFGQLQESPLPQTKRILSIACIDFFLTGAVKRS